MWSELFGLTKEIQHGRNVYKIPAKAFNKIAALLGVGDDDAQTIELVGGVLGMIFGAALSGGATIPGSVIQHMLKIRDTSSKKFVRRFIDKYGWTWDEYNVKISGSFSEFVLYVLVDPGNRPGERRAA